MYACGVVTVQCFPLENAPSPPHQVSSSSAVILISTTAMMYTPVRSTESIPWSLGIHQLFNLYLPYFSFSFHLS